jgi:hypothetical protein
MDTGQSDHLFQIRWILKLCYIIMKVFFIIIHTISLLSTRISLLFTRYLYYPHEYLNYPHEYLNYLHDAFTIHMISLLSTRISLLSTRISLLSTRYIHYAHEYIYYPLAFYSLAWQHHFTMSGGLTPPLFYWRACTKKESKLLCICVVFFVFHFINASINKSSLFTQIYICVWMWRG